MLTLYTKDNCVQCKMTKAVLNQYRIPYQERNISNPEYKTFLLNQNITSMPALFKDNNFLWTGFRPDKIKQFK